MSRKGYDKIPWLFMFLIIPLLFFLLEAILFQIGSVSSLGSIVEATHCLLDEHLSQPSLMVGPLESSAHGHANTVCELGGKEQSKLTCILLVSPLLMCVFPCSMGLCLKNTSAKMRFWRMS